MTEVPDWIKLGNAAGNVVIPRVLYGVAEPERRCGGAPAQTATVRLGSGNVTPAGTTPSEKGDPERGQACRGGKYISLIHSSGFSMGKENL